MTKVPPKIAFDRTEQQAPAVDLRKALWQRHPHMFRNDPGRSYPHLIIRPRCTGCEFRCDREVSPNSWYDVYHAHLALKEYDGYRALLPDPDNVPMEPTYVTIGEPVAHLSAPVMLPYETRRANIPLAEITEADTEFHGSRESAEQARDAQLETAARTDHTKTNRDWDATADSFAEILGRIEALKLTADQRVEVGEIRLWQTENEVVDARKSLEALRANATRVEHNTSQDGLDNT